MRMCVSVCVCVCVSACVLVRACKRVRESERGLAPSAGGGIKRLCRER